MITCEKRMTLQAMLPACQATVIFQTMSVRTLMTPTLKSRRVFLMNGSSFGVGFWIMQRKQDGQGRESQCTGDGEVFDEIIHARFACARHSQRQQDGHVADDDQDQQDPQEGQLLGLIKKKKKKKMGHCLIQNRHHKDIGRYHLVDCLVPLLLLLFHSRSSKNFFYTR